MTDTETALASALRTAHSQLLRDLRALEDSVRLAAKSGFDDLHDRLAATYNHVQKHFRLEEENGYLDAVKKIGPHLERSIEGLRREHKKLTEDLAKLIDESGSQTETDDSLRQRMLSWVNEVRQHETKENDLIQDAFNLDLAAED
ncbi:MAG: hemerythrin domain-containing protein [Planctomycetes bacterium]|nr:hemerythrin domain-containing protein [Planctomycetota bacterium]